MTGHFYLVFNLPGQVKQYYVREAEKLIQGRPVIVPEISPIVRQAHKFNPESAVVFRDRYREQYARDNFEIFVEDHHGTMKFEREVQPASPSEDNRRELFVEPDGLENTGLGFLVRPAIRPAEGFCWCVRACDVPSMLDRASATETIYAEDPVRAVEKMMATWGNLAQPSTAPWAQKQDDAQAKRILQEVHKSQRGSGRVRPGDRS
jgi:hypothetical protein